MSILDLQMEGGAESGVGALLYERDDAGYPGGHDLRFGFTTEFGSDVQESFTVRVSAKGYAKGSPYEGQWRDYEATVPASQCDERRSYSGGRVSWSVPLSLVGSLATEFGPWRYAERKYDTATFDVSIRANWSSDVMGVGGTKDDWHSEWAFAELYMGFLAEYALTAAYYETSELFVIEYRTTWTRQDDRFAIGGSSYVVGDSGGEGILLLSSSPVVPSEVWGTVAAPGRIEVPVSSLSQHLVGKVCHFEVAFNPTYRPIIVGRVKATADLKVGNKAECNSCTLELAGTDEPYHVAIRTGDAGDLESECTEVTVKCRTATGYSSTVTVPCGEVAVMRGCPLNVPLVFEGVGSNGYTTSKKVTVVTAEAIKAKGIALVESADPSGGSVVIKYNQQFSVSSEPECETMKLAGRSRPSAFFGHGGTASVKVDGVLLDDAGTTLEAMPMFGPAYVCFPDGRAYKCKISVSLDWDFPRLRNVSVSGEEVD